jgi:hypothetical protein
MFDLPNQSLVVRCSANDYCLDCMAIQDGAAAILHYEFKSEWLLQNLKTFLAVVASEVGCLFHLSVLPHLADGLYTVVKEMGYVNGLMKLQFGAFRRRSGASISADTSSGLRPVGAKHRGKVRYLLCSTE